MGNEIFRSLNCDGCRCDNCCNCASANCDICYRAAFAEEHFKDMYHVADKKECDFD